MDDKTLSIILVVIGFILAQGMLLQVYVHHLSKKIEKLRKSLSNDGGDC